MNLSLLVQFDLQGIVCDQYPGRSADRAIRPGMVGCYEEEDSKNPEILHVLFFGLFRQNIMELSLQDEKEQQISVETFSPGWHTSNIERRECFCSENLLKGGR